MVKVTLKDIIPSTPPSNGWIVKYRIKGSTGAYLTPSGSPFSSQPIVFNTTDPGGTLYEGKIISDCGSLQGSEFLWETGCDCVSGFVSTGVDCQKIESITPTIDYSNYCLTKATHRAYSDYGARIYKPGFTKNDMILPTGSTGGNIDYNLYAATQWANINAVDNVGPMNRCGVWIDSDCDGIRDDLTAGTKVTVATQFVNNGPNKTIYIGIGGDNSFELIVNGNSLIDTSDYIGDTNLFKIWHILPVEVVSGVNYINGIATGDGLTQNSLGFTIYNNEKQAIIGATSDYQLDIPYSTSMVRDSRYDVAHCPVDYSLDVSNGQGNYMCRKITNQICNKA